MNYLLLTTTALFIVVIIVAYKWYKSKKECEALLVNYHELKAECRYEKERNERLKQAFSETAESASHYKELYQKTLSMYNGLQAKYNECTEDLEFAKAIISGDLSTLVE